MTETTTTTTVSELVDTYFAGWNETDANRRAELVARAWASEGRHVDPLADVTGYDALDALVAGVQAQFPGHRLERTSGIDAHHDQLRYAWQLVAPDGTVVVAATEIAELDGDGRLRRVAAFFGDVPAAG